MRVQRFFPSFGLYFASSALCDGINCDGSIICPGVTFVNDEHTLLMQGLRDGIYKADLPDDTTYQNGDHVICVSESLQVNLGPLFASITGDLGSGGVCVFPQKLQSNLTLGTIKKLADKLLEHGCKTCGSVPVDFLDGGLNGVNDGDDGELTFNYVGDPYCTENCISGANENDSGDTQAGQGSSSTAQPQSETKSADAPSATVAPEATQTSVIVVVLTTSTVSEASNPSSLASTPDATGDQSVATKAAALSALSGSRSRSALLIGMVWIITSFGVGYMFGS